MNNGESKQGLYSEKFRIILEMIAHPDGGSWTGTKMSRATDGKVISSYFTSLRDGHVDVPRADKIEAIAHAMGFPVELWFRDIEWWRAIYDRWLSGDDVALERASSEGHRGGDLQLAQLVNRLFEVRVNLETGELFSNLEVAEQSQGALGEDDIARLRSGDLADPTWAQILVLCEIFEVPPTYFSGSEMPWFPSPALLDAAKDSESYVTFTNSRKLSSKDRSLLHAMSDHLRRSQDT